MSALLLTTRGNASNLFQIEFIFKWSIINLSGHPDFISWRPNCAYVKLLLLEQPDSDLDSLLHKTDERDSLLWFKTFSKTHTESDD